MWYGISIRGTWDEICLGNVELVSRADWFPSDAITTPASIQEDTMHCIERFVVLALYGRTSPYSKINKARKKRFTKRNSAQRIPATYDV